MAVKGKIEVTSMTYSYPGRKPLLALNDVSFTIFPGEFVCILGPTGCGKSTLLNLLGGFLKATSGEILVDDLALKGPDPQIGVVFQEHAVFPWKTVRKNVEFGPKMMGVSKDERRIIAEALIKRVGLNGFEDNYSATLSGGMKQRVGIARALANDPAVMLMDEPFGSLDAQTKITMQELLLEIWDRSHRTIVFVTHDIDEAILLADRLFILSARPGRVQEDIRVTLPRPRSIDFTTSQEFVELKRHILQTFKKLSQKSPTGLQRALYWLLRSPEIDS